MLVFVVSLQDKTEKTRLQDMNNFRCATESVEKLLLENVINKNIYVLN